MKEYLYTIPVNDALGKELECPLCAMRDSLESDAIDYTMGPSYMEDDIRAQTDDKGFCMHHLKMLYNHQNRLGLALILDTHVKKINKDIEQLMKSQPKVASFSLFKKKMGTSNINDYIDKLNSSCFICDKINSTFEHYINTIFHLYKDDPTFVKRFNESKGLCIHHFGLLSKEAPKHLRGVDLVNFLEELNILYIKNMNRVKEDLDWFINKFDYRYTDEPWRTSKDVIPRAMLKTNSIIS